MVGSGVFGIKIDDNWDTIFFIEVIIIGFFS